MIIHDHKIYIFCKLLRVIALAAFFILSIFGICKLYAWPDPLDIEIAKEAIIHNMEMERERELERAHDRLDNGHGNSRDIETVLSDSDFGIS